MAVLLGFGALAVVVAVLPRAVLLRIPGVSRAVVAGMHGTGQTGMRIIFWLLFVMMATASVLDLDIVIGAAAGVVTVIVFPAVARWLPHRSITSPDRSPTRPAVSRQS